MTRTGIDPPGEPPEDAVPELDLRHLRCPLPVLRTRKHLGAMAPGSTVRVLCTDPLAGIDIPHLIRQTGDVLIAHRLDHGTAVFVIRKA